MALTYTFQMPGNFATRPVKVYNTAGVEQASGTTNSNAVFTATLPAGDYHARVSYGYMSYEAAGMLVGGDTDAVVTSVAGLTGAVTAEDLAGAVEDDLGASFASVWQSDMDYVDGTLVVLPDGRNAVTTYDGLTSSSDYTSDLNDGSLQPVGPINVAGVTPDLEGSISSAALAAALPFAQAAGASIDARLLPNGPLKATSGTYVGTFGSGTATISNKRIVFTSGTAHTWLRAAETVRHFRVVVEWPTGADAPLTMVFANSDPSGSLTAGIHATMLPSITGTPAGKVTSGSYNTTPLVTGPDGNAGKPFPGRTTTTDVYLDTDTGRVQILVDGTRVIDYVNANTLNNISDQVDLESSFAPGGVPGKIVKFEVNADNGLRPTEAHGSNSGTPVADVALPNAMTLVDRLVTTITFPPSGEVMISANPYLEMTTGICAMQWNDGTTTGGFAHVAEGPWKGRLNYQALVTGTPGTIKTVQLYAIATNANGTIKNAARGFTALWVVPLDAMP